MEDSFRVRIDKTFGSLTPPYSPSPSHAPSSFAQLNSLWSLTEEEIGSKQWNRNMEESQSRPGPFLSNSFLDSLTNGNKPTESHAQLEKDLDELVVDGGEDYGQEEGRRSTRTQKPDDYNEEEWIIKSSIGLDCTLDFEEEEDEYDKMAVAKENSEEDRLYMKAVNDYETEADDWDALPITFKDMERDPRANHMAAKLRLEEDTEAAYKMNSLHVSEDSLPENRIALGAAAKTETFLVYEDNLSKSLHSTSKVTESDKSFLSLSETRDSLPASADEVHVVGILEVGDLRPILKRKDYQQTDPKLQKRVRFSSEYFKGGTCIEEDKGSAMETFSVDANKVDEEFPSGVPDYMRNPSKYTRYSFDSGEMDEECNRKAYMDFLNMMESRKKGEEPDPEEFPRSVMFVPKRKGAGESGIGEKRIEKSSEGKRSVMAVHSVEEDDVCPMEEDDDVMVPAVDAMMRSDAQRSERQYRNKAKQNHDEC